MIARSAAVAVCVSLLLYGCATKPAPAPVAPAPAPTAPAAPAPIATPPNDYSQQSTWLCLPDHLGACDTDETATVVYASGKTKTEKFVPAKNPPIDCFYVYPTVSREPTLVSDMAEGPEEIGVVKQQFARFAAACRPFAPLYRQYTLAAIAARMTGQKLTGVPADPQVGYHDVRDAWNYYLAHFNHGRGVVLVGHSQGSGVLIQLIKNDIDGKPVQKQLVSAILMGSRVQVPVGKDVGGVFQTVPLCHAPHETGCVIAYASFRASSPPPANSRFGKGEGAGMEAACVNPAALGGGSGPAHSYLSNNVGIFNGTSFDTEWVKGKKLDTPFVSVPGLITAECQKNDVGTYLAISLRPDPRGQRTNDIKGDVVLGGQVQKDWGLHLIDANLFMGNLVSIVESETKAYLAKKPTPPKQS